ncbi:MAG: ATP-binding protein [Faecalibacterium prausnitzii]
MMQRALHNLLGNAMHHIGKDGIFILRAQRCTEGVRIEVEDHGPGISADDLPLYL